MCVAVVCKPGAIVTPDRLWSGWLSNQDGGGFAYVKDDEVVIEKGFLKYNDFERAYTKAAEEYAAESPFLVHMRIKTSGSKKAENCHPFPIKNGALIHNGVLFYPTGAAVREDKSDTRIFAERSYNILHLEDVLRAERDILNTFGVHNKLAFLYNDKRYLILNERSGYWHEDIWYSNSSCTPYKSNGKPTEND